MLTLTPELPQFIRTKGFNWKVLPNEISYEIAQKWLTDVHKVYLEVTHDTSNPMAIMYVYEFYDSKTGYRFNSLQSKQAFVLREQAWENGLNTALSLI